MNLTDTRENQGEIDDLLLKTTLSTDQQGTQANIADKIADKSKLLKTQNIDRVTEFKFGVKMFSLESVLEDLNKFNFKLNEFIESFGTSNIIYISLVWEEGSIEYKRDNLNTKYVKISDNSTARQGYTISNAFSYGIQAQIQKILSYLDSEKKIINWETVMLKLKALAKSSGYTENDIQKKASIS